MTYFGFLLIFLIAPIILLAGLTLIDRRRGHALPDEFRHGSSQSAILGLVLIAVVYTTPWDNYLVANRVWWYDPALVSGLVLGWVPLEEYTFFVVQPILAGLWFLYVARRVLPITNPWQERRRLRWGSTLGLATLWLVAMGILIAGWKPGTYLALELAWALPPIMLQLAFGADIVWHQRRLVLLTVVPMTLYLSLADALAIGAGTWTINPALSLQIYLGWILPLEEFIFFLLTNILITFSLVLLLARRSQDRLRRGWLHQIGVE